MAVFILGVAAGVLHGRGFFRTKKAEDSDTFRCICLLLRAGRLQDKLFVTSRIYNRYNSKRLQTKHCP